MKISNLKFYIKYSIMGWYDFLILILYELIFIKIQQILLLKM